MSASTVNRYFAWEFTCGACFSCNSESDLDSLLLCEGGCRRSFHLHCVGLSTFPGGQQSWSCRWCIQRLRICWLCQTYSPSAQLDRCSHSSCAKTFHASCLIAKGLPELKPGNFCSFHSCFSTSEKCPKTDITEDGFFCTKCPRNFHAKCLPPNAIPLGENFCLCDSHMWKGKSLDSISRSGSCVSSRMSPTYSCGSTVATDDEVMITSEIVKLGMTPYVVPSWLRDDIMEVESAEVECDKSGMEYEKIKSNSWLCAKPPKLEIEEGFCFCREDCGLDCSNAMSFIQCDKKNCNRPDCSNRPFLKKKNSRRNFQVQTAGKKGVGLIATETILKCSFIV